MTGGLIDPQSKPWENEPDYEYFSHAGVECLVQRMPNLGYVNGYIALPNVHPWYFLDHIDEAELNFLWPITFFKRSKDIIGIGQVVVLGFDTMSNGYWPAVDVGDPARYRTFAWVTEQTRKLAAEARSAGKVKIPRSRQKPENWMYPWNLIAE